MCKQFFFENKEIGLPTCLLTSYYNSKINLTKFSVIYLQIVLIDQ